MAQAFVMKWIIPERNCVLEQRKLCTKQTNSTPTGFKQIAFESLLQKGSIYTERQRQCCDVVSDIILIKLLRFHNKPSVAAKSVAPTDQM